MITFFTIPRPFVGEFDELQCAAIRSWLGAAPGCEIILMGDEPGVRPGIGEVATELGLRHIPDLECNEYGTPLVGSAFAVADQVARFDVLCEISADIIMGGEIPLVLEAIKSVERPLVIGRRWDVDRGAPRTARLHPPCGIDYFLYRRGTLGEIPPFAVGRMAYDNWIVWSAAERWGMTVIDATDTITAVHVNHGYPAWDTGKRGLLDSEERTENMRLFREAGASVYGVNHAPFVISRGEVVERG